MKFFIFSAVVLLNICLTYALLDQQCLECICEASTGCQPNPCIASKGHQLSNCGPYKLSPKYYAPHAKQGYDYETCANTKSCAQQVVASWLNSNSVDCDNDGLYTCLDYALSYKYGPVGCRNKENYENDEYYTNYLATSCADSTSNGGSKSTGPVVIDDEQPSKNAFVEQNNKVSVDESSNEDKNEQVDVQVSSNTGVGNSNNEDNSEDSSSNNDNGSFVQNNKEETDTSSVNDSSDNNVVQNNNYGEENINNGATKSGYEPVKPPKKTVATTSITSAIEPVKKVVYPQSPRKIQSYLPVPKKTIPAYVPTQTVPTSYAPTKVVTPHVVPAVTTTTTYVSKGGNNYGNGYVKGPSEAVKTVQKKIHNIYTPTPTYRPVIVQKVVTSPKIVPTPVKVVTTPVKVVTAPVKVVTTPVKIITQPAKVISIPYKPVPIKGTTVQITRPVTYPPKPSYGRPQIIQVREQVPQQVTYQVREPVPQQVTYQVREPVPQQVTYQVREPAPQQPTYQVREPAPQQPTYQIREPVPQVTYQVREPIPQHVTYQVREPAQVTYQVREPQQVTYQVKEPAPQQVTYQVREPAPQVVTTVQVTKPQQIKYVVQDQSGGDVLDDTSNNQYEEQNDSGSPSSDDSSPNIQVGDSQVQESY